MNNPFDYTPDVACDVAFHELTVRIETLKKSDRPEDINFCRELEEGKMLGVLITKDRSGISHSLYAFSGQLGNGGFFHDGFVGPVFDYLQPDGHFKTKEADISRQNIDISLFEKGSLATIKKDFESTKERLEVWISEYREECRLSKLKRDVKRKSGIADETELAAMIRQSQFEKAELHRLKKKAAAELKPFEENLKRAQERLEAMKTKRRLDSEILQQWLFNNFKLLNARGETKSLSEIFADTPMRIPPSGAGECCAPKLLHAAYMRGWQPIAIAEYWYGKPKEGEVRIHGMHYPACRGKCLPVLSWMLQGLDVNPPIDKVYATKGTGTPKILYENDWFCVLEKPAGMLSVRGKSGLVSVEQWLTDYYGNAKQVKMAHRLDQDTSGLIVATFGPEAYKVMQNLFATRCVKKTYEAVLEGDFRLRGIPRCGVVELALSPDWIDRPRQRVDMKEGKPAETYYQFIGVEEGRSRILFHPQTGRTHQLRVHAASESGLGMPIVGDRLYGERVFGEEVRLHLHACEIEFIYPIDGHQYRFESQVPF